MMLFGNDTSSTSDVAITPEASAVQVAKTIIDNIAQVSKLKQKAQLKKTLDQIDPTLFSRTKKNARALKAQGESAGQALLQGLAAAYLHGQITELHSYGQIALAAQGYQDSSTPPGVSGLGLPSSFNASSILDRIRDMASNNATVSVSSSAITPATVYWPYVPVTNEAVLQLGQVAAEGGTMTLPAILTLPLKAGLVPINVVPKEYGWLADVLDQATTFFEPFSDFRQGSTSSGGWQTCMKGTRFYWQTGVDLSRTPLGPYMPTIDGGHSVPVMRQLLQDPYSDALDSATGNPCCNGNPNWQAGLPMFQFQYPGTTDVWGIYLVAQDVHLDPTNDNYIPPAWRDKAAPVGVAPASGRLQASKLAFESRPMTAAEIATYNAWVDESKNYASAGCGFSLAGAFTGLTWFLEEIGEFLWAVIKTVAEVAVAVAEAVGAMACQLLQQPGGAGAVVKAAGGGVSGGVAVGAGAVLASATGCQAIPPPIVCPAGQAIDPATGLCVSTTPWTLYLVLGVGALGALLIAKKKKTGPAPSSAHSG